jgi:hypothetical protein
LNNALSEAKREAWNKVEGNKESRLKRFVDSSGWDKVPLYQWDSQEEKKIQTWKTAVLEKTKDLPGCNAKVDEKYGIVIEIYCHPFTNHETFGKELTAAIQDAKDAKKTITIWVLIVIVILLLLMFLNNLNHNSLHYFYRDHLSKTYLIKWGREMCREEKVEEQEPPLRLEELHENNNGPYHLINATLNVPFSKNASLNGRGADFFIFSKAYCGAESTGYRRTEDYNGGKTQLATAMAISGAAASPEMGTGTNPALSFLMTLLNIRLHLWMPNPNQNPKRVNRIFWPLYLFKEFFRHSKEDDALLNLSDGGHHENLGIYALLKRRCRFIIASDAGADPDNQMKDFVNLQRKARIDLGINIDIDLSNLRPDEKNRYTKAYFVKGTIQYPDSEEGTLFYIKTTMTGTEPEELLAYRRKSSTFPDETTADQFFNEEQFESYRKLGEWIGEKFCSEKVKDDKTGFDVLAEIEQILKPTEQHWGH